ncbi:MAG TPA: transporter substrate-binding domain-containing protein, partial [Burkholderiales bacterium]
MKSIALLGALAVAAGCAQTPSAPSPEAKAQLAPSGTLRVAVLTSNPIIGSKDAATGEVKGTTVELGRALAASAGVPVRMIDYPAIPKLMADAGTNTWDVAVVAIDPARRNLVDFAPAHLAADGFLTILVPPGSSARTMADFDKPGMRVAAVKNAAPLMILERTL